MSEESTLSLKPVRSENGSSERGNPQGKDQRKCKCSILVRHYSVVYTTNCSCVLIKGSVARLSALGTRSLYLSCDERLVYQIAGTLISRTSPFILSFIRFLSIVCLFFISFAFSFSPFSVIISFSFILFPLKRVGCFLCRKHFIKLIKEYSSSARESRHTNDHTNKPVTVSSD